MAVQLLETKQKPNFLPPLVIPWKPQIGEYITRPIGQGESIEFSYDPHAINSGMAAKKYGYVAVHPSVQAPLKILVEGPFWTEWNIHENNDYNQFPDFEAIDEEIIELIKYQIDNTQNDTFRNILKSIWRDCLVYGFSISEMNYQHDGNYMCINSIKTHSPFNFDIYTDQGNNLCRLYYSLTGTWIERPTLEKFIVATYPYVEHGKFFGTSILQSIYFDVKLIEILEQSYAEGSRRLAIKPIIHQYVGKNMSQEELETVRNALFNMDSASLVSLSALQDSDGKMVPEHDIKVLEDRASWEGVQNIQTLLDILYKRVNRTLGLPDDLGFTQTNVGSYAKSKEEMSLYTQNVVNNQNFIENIVNKQIIPAMIKYNYPSVLEDKDYKLPTFYFGSVEEEYDTSQIQNMRDLIDMGALDKVKDLPYIREKLNLPTAPSEMLETTPVENDNIIEETPSENPDVEQIKQLTNEVRRAIHGKY